jgi:hypothetical protein
MQSEMFGLIMWGEERNKKNVSFVMRSAIRRRPLEVIRKISSQIE